METTDNVKHTPATPLPWYRHGISHVYNTARSNIGPSEVGGEWPVCYATFTEPKDGAPQNAAYIVHAANAYPRLVAALRWFVTCKGTLDFDGEIGRSLLRELGE